MSAGGKWRWDNALPGMSPRRAMAMVKDAS
jgi:hypothetical protein